GNARESVLFGQPQAGRNPGFRRDRVPAIRELGDTLRSQRCRNRMVAGREDAIAREFWLSLY
ncbi:MAG TPA: hypothetical protein VE242_00545, partial [Chthoniobacterales bacterium]|nr:hypothetical protein [Chthoniobacterales bacterium]